MLVQVNSLIGAPEDVTLKDGKVIQKQRFLAADGKQYVTFAKVEAGQSYDGEVSPDSFSGELRFKKTKVPFTPRGGGGESNRQTALKAAAMLYQGLGANLDHNIINVRASLLLDWLEAGSQGQGTNPPQSSDASAQTPAQPALKQVFPDAEQVPIEAYEEM